MRSRSFLTLYLAVFAATMGISMVGPLLPVYAEELGASGAWLGLTFSVFAIVQTIVGPFAGKLSDRYGRKPFIVVGLVIYFLAALGYLAAGNFYWVIAFRAFTGFGTSFIFSVSRAYVGDMTPTGQEGRWFGVYATADILGFGTGPIVAGVLREVFGFEAVFVGMATMMAISALIVAIFLPARPPRHLRIAAGPAVATIGLMAALRDRLTLALTINFAVQSMAMGATFAFLGLRLELDLGATPVMVGLAFATQDITGGLAQPLWGRLADRANRRVMIGLGLAWSAVFLGLMGYVASYEAAVVCLLCAGAGGAAAQVASAAVQVVAGRRVGMGTLLGLSSAGSGAGIVAGSLVGGILIDAFSVSATFLFGAVIMVIANITFLILTRGLAMNEREPERVGDQPAPAPAGAGP